jgi:hypothetical protein
MSDWKVEMANDSMAEFHVEFHGPKESAWRKRAGARPAVSSQAQGTGRVRRARASPRPRSARDAPPPPSRPGARNCSSGSSLHPAQQAPT